MIPKLTAPARHFLLAEIRKQPWLVAVFIVMSGVAAVLETMGVALVFPLLFLIVDPDALDRFRALTWLRDVLGLESRSSLYIFLISTIATLVIAKNLYMAGFQFMQMRLMARWKVALSRRLMRIYLFSPYDLHMRKTSSEIIRNVSLTASVYDQFIMSCIQMLTYLVVASGLITLLVVILPGETGFGVSVLMVSAIGVYLSLRRTIVALGKDANVIFEQRQRVLQQSIGAIRDTKVLGKERFFLDRFSSVEGRYFDNQRKYNFLALLPSLVSEATVILSILGLVSYVLFVSPERSHALATLALLAATMFRLAPQFNRILGCLQILNLSRHGLETIAQELHDLEDSVEEPPDASRALDLERAIVFDKVSYRYPGTDTRAVSEVDLQVRAGEFIGITGPSGAGKSTMMALLMGLLEPSEGTISVDGEPLAGATRIRQWQNGIGYVPQSVFVTQDSIVHNVAYGVDDADIDREHAFESVRLAELGSFVDKSPLGLDESAGENGQRLSGGERQRLGIARAMYVRPNLLALDEATSSLDVKTERAVSERIAALQGDKTVIAIAHRISTLRNCDRIVMMEDGRITDVGAFAELQGRCEAFQRLVKLSSLEEVDTDAPRAPLGQAVGRAGER